MLFSHLATILFLALFHGALALPISTTRSVAAPAVNAFDLITSRGIAALKELAAEQSTIFVAQPAQYNAVAKRISEKANNAITATKYSAAQMRAAPALGNVDALALWGSVQSLSTAADETMKNFVKMKSIVYQMNNGPPAVLAILKGMKDCSREFTTAMSGKMPFVAKYVGEYYGNSVDTMVADTIKEYQTPPAGSGLGLGLGWF